MFVVKATTSTFVMLSVTSIGLKVIPLLTGVGYAITISNKIIYEIVVQTYNKNKKHYESTTSYKLFCQVFWKSVQDHVIDKKKKNLFELFLQNTRVRVRTNL